MPTLAELRAQSGPQPLPRKTVPVTLVEGQHLLAEMEELTQEAIDLTREKRSLEAEISRKDSEGEQSGPPRKAGEGASTVRRLEEVEARLAAIEVRQDALVDSLAEFQGEVGLVGFTGGKWEQFKEANPPREDNAADQRYAGGHCDSSAVFAALGKFVKQWGGEDLADDDWSKWLAERITYADRRDLVTEIVGLHEKKINRSPKIAERIAYDQPFRDRLKLARALNVSHKRILGWEPTETHEYHYDDESRVSKVVVTREPEWDDVERANMLALAEYEADLCHCGLPTALADTDPDLQVKYRQCPVCAGLGKVTRIQADNDAKLTSQVYGKKGPQPGDERPEDGRHFAGFEALDAPDAT